MAVKVTRKIVLNVLLVVALVAAVSSIFWTSESPTSNIGMSMIGRLVEHVKAS